MLASDFHRHQPNTALTASTPPQWGLKRTVFIVYLNESGTLSLSRLPKSTRLARVLSIQFKTAFVRAFHVLEVTQTV